PTNLNLRMRIAESLAKEGMRVEASRELVYVARLCAEKGDSSSAEQHFNRALALVPENKDAYLSMSKMYETMGKTEEAQTLLHRAMEVFPGDSAVMLSMAQILARCEQYDQASRLLREISAIEPDNVRVKEETAKIHLRKGETETAWGIYRQIFPRLLTCKRREQLIDTLTMFSAIDPVDVGRKLASLYRDAGEIDNCVQELIKVATTLKDMDMHSEALEVLGEAHEMRPDDDEVALMMSALQEDSAVERGGASAQKNADEILTEVDVLLSYDQPSEALRILDELREREPSNPDLHLRLKTIYSAMGELELAVTECLVLAGIFEREGDLQRRDGMLREARDIDPSDPRLPEEAVLEPEPAEGRSFAEEIAEADFYAQQGLLEEALSIYRKYEELMPEDQKLKGRISALLKQREEVEYPDTGISTPEEALGAVQEESGIGEAAPDHDQLSVDRGVPPVPAEEIPEPTLEDEVLEIFEEFKRGLESELEDEDSETHYNLGIAYKEMGLIDDAIKEFQTANRDPEKKIQASSMLGHCFKEKGLYSLAIEVLATAVSLIERRDDSYWGAVYDLADAYELNGNLNEALDMFTEVFAYNSKLRKVDERLNVLKERLAHEQDAAGAAPSEPKKKKDRISYL
ncbi:MAG: tetratricopeptide repeat protein, partial [Thermodesulfovibrionales bacterium]